MTRATSTAREPKAGSGATQSSAEHRKAFERFLETRGLKLTRQRQAVLREIFQDNGHFEAEELVTRLRGSSTRVSRATVYRTLELLQECQLVDKLDFGTTRSFYEHISPDAHHDHLICTVCGTVIEFHNPQLEGMQQEICSRYNFQETHHSLRIFGKCDKCQRFR